MRCNIFVTREISKQLLNRVKCKILRTFFDIVVQDSPLTVSDKSNPKSTVQGGVNNFTLMINCKFMDNDLHYTRRTWNDRILNAQLQCTPFITITILIITTTFFFCIILGHKNIIRNTKDWQQADATKICMLVAEWQTINYYA